MHEAGLVRGSKAVSNLRADEHHFARRKGPRDDPLAKGYAVDEFHHEKVGARLATDIEDGEDARMIQRRCRTGLPFEAIAECRIVRRVWRQDLDRDGALQSRIAGTVDFAHAACTKCAEDFVWTKTRA